jgi:hypothetical protein
MKKLLTIVSSVLIYYSFLISCSKGSSGGGSGGSVDCSTVPKSFSADVNPIVQSTCNNGTGCHGTGSVNGPGPLTNYTQVFNARNAIRPQIVSGAMPQGSSLSTAQKNSFICWIDSGAPNN